MPFQIKFAAMTLDGLTDWSEEVSSRVSPERFPRRQGAVLEPVPFLSERSIRVSGFVDKSTEAALVTYLKDVGAKLHNGTAPLYLRDDATYINAVKTNYGYSFKAGEAAHLRAKYFIDFVAGDPYWYSETVNTSTQTNVASSPHSFSVTNTGGEATPVKIDITALSVDKTGTFKLTNTTNGLSASYGGTITAGQVLTIDCATLKVVNSGANGLPGFSGSFWMLVIGTNNVTYEGPTGVTIVVSWTNRWS